ncbi:hypothetical protein CTEN210_11831 [Chaetoceros tenuissimus]|uniref:cyclic pyranopterin monophosphate synthase n=1 Tax=Chaetoceros tenuissimus TaxID=426638 RepID=A0AAD3H9H5_9STRA|nr:hypothetical protein CTEN210_11831 [Chaetoceros tenuissimus]
MKRIAVRSLRHIYLSPLQRRTAIRGPVSQFRFFSKDSKEHHQSYQDQLKELQEERISLFGTDDSAQNISNNQNDAASSIPSQPPEQELTIEEMNADREAIYNFSKEEKAAWGSNSIDKVYNQEFLDAVAKAREAKAIYEKTLNQDLDQKMQDIANEAKSEYNSSNSNVEAVEEEIKDTHISNESSQPFTHLNSSGDQASMVDVGHKIVTRRTAKARSTVLFPPSVMSALGINTTSENHEMIGKKGPIFSTAKIAGIMASKRTSDLIPLCHPLPLENVKIDIRLEGNRAIVECECSVSHKTGVEMEALAGASVAALTIYDMVKAVSHEVKIENTELVSKTGGKRLIEDGKQQ